MIVYREFSSLVKDLGISAKTLYSVSNNITRHYHAVTIPKKNGGERRLFVPDKLLKVIQRRINDTLLCYEGVSCFASAYRPCSSTVKNAAPHISKNALLKLDVKNFFDNIIYPLVKEKAFPAFRYSEQSRILLTMLCIFNDSLPQGAPTSPAISNIVMKDFDDAVGKWCESRNISYSRYCDDMTFSGDLDPVSVISFIRTELKKLGLYLNDKNTVFVKKGKRQAVTGIVVNEKLSIPADYKKKIRKEMYYCMRFGVASHLERCGIKESLNTFIQKLLGRINYVLSVEPRNNEMIRYAKWLKDKINK